MKLCLALCLCTFLVCLTAAVAPAASTEYLSVGLTGGPAVGVMPIGEGMAMSADGRYVAFTSDASNLVPGDTNLGYDVFVRDRVGGVTERISVGAGGVQGDGPSSRPAMSADGRYVAFISEASTLAPGLPVRARLFLRDRLRGVTKRVSVGASGVPIRAEQVAISADGRYLAFASFAKLKAKDTDRNLDVYLWNRTTRQVSLVSVNSLGKKGNSGSGVGALGISDDGQLVAFCSAATNLAPGVTDGSLQVYVRDRAAKTTECISTEPGMISSVGEEGTSLSADGRFVAFASTGLISASNKQVFVRDRVTGTLELISATPDEEPTEALDVLLGPLSADGRFIVFTACATDLAPGKDNTHPDVFVRDRLAGVTRLVSVNNAEESSNACCVPGPLAISDDGSCTAFASNATNLTLHAAPGFFARSGLTWPPIVPEP